MSIASDATPLGDSPRLWAGQTADERAAVRQRQLLAAGRTLLCETGAAGVTVRAVAREAELSPRYFYESFESREALLVALFDEIFDEIATVARESMRGVEGDFLSQARASIDGVTIAEDGAVPAAAALMTETVADATLRDRARQKLPLFVAEMARSSLGPALSEADPADPPPWLRVAIAAVAGSTIALLLERVEGRLALPREEFVDHMFRIVSATAIAALPPDADLGGLGDFAAWLIG